MQRYDGSFNKTQNALYYFVPQCVPLISLALLHFFKNCRWRHTLQFRNVCSCTHTRWIVYFPLRKFKCWNKAMFLAKGWFHKSWKQRNTRFFLAGLNVWGLHRQHANWNYIKELYSHFSPFYPIFNVWPVAARSVSTGNYRFMICSQVVSTYIFSARPPLPAASPD